MALYTVTTVGFALDVERKRLENLLLREPPPGVSPGRQGRKRRLTLEQVTILAAILELEDALEMPLTAAAAVVRRLREPTSANDENAEGGTINSARAGPVILQLDWTGWRHVVAARLAAALEMAPRPVRGRPPKI